MKVKKIYDLFSIYRWYERLFLFVRGIAKPFGLVLIPYFNRRLRPTRRVIPKRGSTLQMVIRPDERAYVGWPVISYALRPFIRTSNGKEEGEKESSKRSNGGEEGEEDVEESVDITIGRLLIAILIILPLAVAFFIALVNLSPGIQDAIFPKGLPEITQNVTSMWQVILQVVLVIVLMVLLIFSLWTAGLIWTYWRYEWERRHTILAVFLEGILHLEAEFITRMITPFFEGDNVVVDNLTEIDLIRDVQIATDIQNLLGGAYTPPGQDRWNQYLSKRYRVLSLRVGSRAGADDLFVSVKWADTTMACINQLIDLGKAYKNLFVTYQENESKALSEDAGTKKFDEKDRAGLVKKIWAGFDGIYPTLVERYNDGYEDLVDPREWDRENGRRVSPDSGSDSGSAPVFMTSSDPDSGPNSNLPDVPEGTVAPSETNTAIAVEERLGRQKSFLTNVSDSNPEIDDGAVSSLVRREGSGALIEETPVVSSSTSESEDEPIDADNILAPNEEQSGPDLWQTILSDSDDEDEE